MAEFFSKQIFKEFFSRRKTRIELGLGAALIIIASINRALPPFYPPESTVFRGLWEFLSFVVTLLFGCYVLLVKSVFVMHFLLSFQWKEAFLQFIMVILLISFLCAALAIYMSPMVFAT